jgi:hypothetical protein
MLVWMLLFLLLAIAGGLVLGLLARSVWRKTTALTRALDAAAARLGEARLGEATAGAGAAARDTPA